MGEGAGKSSEAGVQPSGSRARVFISYSSQDTDTANAICESLEGQGVPCWISPRDVRPGAEYADAIVRAINDAEAIVLVMSAGAVASAHVGREIERAASKRKLIIAFRIDAAPLSAAMEYFLSQSQWIDVPALGMKAALAKLAEAVGSASSSPAVATVGHSVAQKKTARRVIIAAAVLIGLGVALAAGIRFLPGSRGGSQQPAAITDKSIAVLPFVDMSEKKDREYVGDGMAEEIINLLVRIPGLKVIGRTSSFQFKGKNEDLRKIGTELNAAYVLEGSVRSSDDQVRITAQLIDARTGAHAWSETYDRPIGDVLKMQDAIAAGVARELQLTVASDHLPSRSTLKDPDLYDLILRGRHAFDRFDSEGFSEAAALFQRALDRDPKSADAAAELAYAYEAEAEWGFLAPSAGFEQARRLTATALRLDPTNARAHHVLGYIHIIYDWDWPGAIREFQQAATLAPGSADGLIGQALVSRTLGRWDDALRQNKAGIAQDPLSPDGFAILMKLQWSRGNFPEAEALARRVLDIRPTYGNGHFYLGLVLLARGDREAALREMQQETSDNAQQEGLAIAYYALGRKGESDAALARMLKQRADSDAFGIAEVYAFRSQVDEAMQWLDRAYAQKDVRLYRINIELPLKSLEADPRFKALLKKMNLPE